MKVGGGVRVRLRRVGEMSKFTDAVMLEVGNEMMELASEDEYYLDGQVITLPSTIGGNLVTFTKPHPAKTKVTVDFGGETLVFTIVEATDFVSIRVREYF